MAKKTVMDAGKFVPTEAMFKAIDSNFEEVVYNKKATYTTAQINAGVTVLSARVGRGYRLISCSIIAIGGAAGANTTIDVKGTQAATAVSLVAYARASLTENAVLNDGASGAAVLAAGASYNVCDDNTAITAINVGTAMTTATSVMLNITFAVE